MATTLHDVAKLAGVSAKTVSNVVNDYPHIKAATKERVLAAIAELGYRPNLSARGLRSGRSGVISLIVPDLRNAYFAEPTRPVAPHRAERWRPGARGGPAARGTPAGRRRGPLQRVAAE
jgi:DNA-binding LacI/PurR family transcriptional regulator